jgi:Holliday junction DNA helicase RuvA
MIFQLKGRLALSLDDSIIISVNGVGYQVYIPETIRHQLPELGGEMELFTIHHIREDHQHLYGFTNLQDRELFTVLTSVSGVGPKVGIKILSYLNSQQLITAIVQEDIVALTQVSGVGKKMAERLCVELKDKLSKLEYSHLDMDAMKNTISSTANFDDYMLALKSLGYTNDEIKRALNASNIEPGTPVEDGLKVLLKHL